MVDHSISTFIKVNSYIVFDFCFSHKWYHDKRFKFLRVYGLYTNFTNLQILQNILNIYKFYLISCKYINYFICR